MYAGPGINDDGSGTIGILEVAEQLSAYSINNAVRFGWWSGEEFGLLGSEYYVSTLHATEAAKIRLYLNFDMIASPNPGYFTYDGDQSSPPTPTPVRIPEGSAGLERTLAQYLAAAGKPPRDTSFDGRSDYDAFTQAGIPCGGLFSGAEDRMSADEAKLWGGTADAPFDPNYHQNSDRVDLLDHTSLGIQGKGVAYAVGVYAQDLGGRNGVPVREDRTRHVVAES